MKYKILADNYEKIEKTSSRLEMTDILVDLIKKTPPEVLPKIVYLTQGKLYPDFMGIEIGMAEKTAAKAFAKFMNLEEEEILQEIRKIGDLGQAAFNLMKKHNFEDKEILTVDEVYQGLDQIAKIAGVGTVEKRMKLLGELLLKASPIEAKYLLRTVVGKLRLGLADMTILDALSIAFGGGKHTRQIVERAYNLTSDLGEVALKIAKEGIRGVEKITVKPGNPIRPMLAERLSSPKEILEKMGGECAVEYKYDGERLQIHKDKNNIWIYSRRLENITHQYPDIIDAVKKFIKADSIIFEGEVVVYNPNTGEILPFQQLMKRRRKYDIKKTAEEYPATLFIFDCLYLDGEDLTQKSYLYRRKLLEKIVEKSEKIQLSNYIIVNNPKELEEYFEQSISQGLEGVVCKSISDQSVYRAGARGWLWIKYKRDYKSEMIDTVDLVVVGAFYGRGKRAGFYGALLLATYDPEKDQFSTVTKCGSGFSEEDLKKMPQLLKDYKISHPHPRLNINTKFLKPDVYFIPNLVLEIIGAEITLSPIHTCCFNKIKKDVGLAIRFPRFTGNYRIDKAPEDATQDIEILKMYQSQLKKFK